MIVGGTFRMVTFFHKSIEDDMEGTSYGSLEGNALNSFKVMCNPN